MSGEGEREIRTLEGAAAFFKVALPTMRDWVSKPDFPVVEAGGQGKPYRIDLREAAAWHKARLEREVADRETRAERDEQLRFELFGEDRLDEPEEMRKLSPAEREAWHRGEVQRVKLAEMRGDLVNATELKLDLAAMGAHLRDRLRALGDTVAEAADLEPAQTDTINEAVDQVLEDLADELERMGNDRDLASAA